MRGFSLVELSIVLVILGLLTGGILAGQNLIRASELRAVTSEFNRYSAAVYTFRDKYFALPGDMRNATDFWGEAASGTACATSTATGTCNGNGDGNLIGSTPGSNEDYRFWQQLALAGLIEGTYSGVNGPGTNVWDSVIAVNVPRSKLSNAGWSAHGATTASTGGSHFPGPYSIRLFLGSETTNGSTDSPVFRPEEMWNIDTKMDDGRPGLGKVMSYTTNSCTTTAVRETAEYSLNNTSVACQLLGQPGW